MYTRDNEELSEAMTDAEHIEEAHRRIRTRNLRTSMSNRPSKSSVITRGSAVARMDVGSAQVKRLSPAEKALCIRKGI